MCNMKALLKKIFPIVWLREMALWVNGVKIKTFDRLVYREYQPKGEEVILMESKNPFLELKMDLHEFEASVQEGFSRWLDPAWKQDQYIIEIKDKTIRIDPHRGWGVIGKNKLIYYSLGFARAAYVRKPKLPHRGISKLTLSKVISLRDTGEENYFHAYNDILPKLFLLKEYSLLDKSASIVVSKSFWAKEYFQTLKNNSWLKDLNWYVQDTEWIETSHAIFCKPYTHTKKYLQQLTGIMKAVPGVDRRIMLTRSRSSLRFIENEEEVFAVLKQYGFERLDTTGMSLEQQVVLFCDVSHLVAIHGAGITNIIYRRGTLHLLELFHHNEYLPFHYIMLARIFGFHYGAVRGQQGQQSSVGGFYINPKQVEAYCKSVFRNA